MPVNAEATRLAACFTLVMERPVRVISPLPEILRPSAFWPDSMSAMPTPVTRTLALPEISKALPEVPRTEPPVMLTLGAWVELIW